MGIVHFLTPIFSLATDLLTVIITYLIVRRKGQGDSKSYFEESEQIRSWAHFVACFLVTVASPLGFLKPLEEL